MQLMDQTIQIHKPLVRGRACDKLQSESLGWRKDETVPGDRDLALVTSSKVLAQLSEVQNPLVSSWITAQETRTDV